MTEVRPREEAMCRGVLPSRSLALMSSVFWPILKTYSTTEGSAHWTARCRMVFPSSFVESSRRCLLMPAVSPCRKASKTLNSLTDCSIDVVEG